MRKLIVNDELNYLVNILTLSFKHRLKFFCEQMSHNTLHIYSNEK
jgi:hypothetical protein